MAALVVSLSAWWASRVVGARASVPTPANAEPIEPRQRDPDRVTFNAFGLVKTVQPQFFSHSEQPAVGVVLTFADGRTIAFACRPSQFGSVAACVGTEARVLVGERDGVRDWLVSAGP